MRPINIAVVLLLPLMIPSLVAAQYSYGGRFYGSRYYGPYNGRYHASTVYESRARGYADAVRSQGLANVANAEAAKRYQEAYSKYLDNRVKATEAYWARREIGDQQRAKKYEQIAARRSAYHARHPDKNPRPSDTQLDPISGEITWPPVAALEEYKEYRQAYQEIFSRRAQDGQLTPEDYLMVDTLKKDFQGALIKNKAKYPSQDYADAMRFIQHLVNEAAAPPGS